MTDSIRHRGPDDEGFVLIDTRSGSSQPFGGPDTPEELGLPSIEEAASGCNLALGNRRLAILDVSPQGHGPMAYRSGDLWLTYNGEIYNYVELRSELVGKGHSFETGTDTEVILAAYAEWGPECLRRFNGMFALAIWDGPKRRLFCARDRFGIKPFYYHRTDQAFVFGSEIKSILASDVVGFEPNEEVVYDYLTYPPVNHSTETFFSGVRVLPAAHYMIIDIDSLEQKVRRWWDLEVNDELRTDPADEVSNVERFGDLLTDSVRLRLRSDVAVGTCLSGGLDSSSIAVKVNQLLRDSGLDAKAVGDMQRTFTACFEEPDIDERPWVDSVVAATLADGHQVFPQADDLWSGLDDLIWHQEEPFASTSIFAQWSVMSLAKRRGVTVLLDGQGADELLGGYIPYAGPFLSQTLTDRGPRSMWRAATDLSRSTRRSRRFLLLLGLYNFLPGPAQRLAARFGRRFRSNDTPGSRFVEPGLDSRLRDRRSAPIRRTTDRVLSDRLVRDMFTTSLPALLRYEDRNSMAHSIEARVPFLDHRLVEFAFSLPAEFRIGHGWTKWILRQAMQNQLPEDVRLRRGKIGFATPEDLWLQAGMGRLQDELRSSEVLSSRFVSDAAVGALAGEADLLAVPGAWRLINLELWLRAFSAR